MLEAIRNIKLGWIIILMGLIFIASGISMKEGQVGDSTFVCFDEGCIYVQGISNILIGILCIGLVIYMNVKK